MKLVTKCLQTCLWAVVYKRNNYFCRVDIMTRYLGWIYNPFLKYKIHYRMFASVSTIVGWQEKIQKLVELVRAIPKWWDKWKLERYSFQFRLFSETYPPLWIFTETCVVLVLQFLYKFFKLVLCLSYCFCATSWNLCCIRLAVFVLSSILSGFLSKSV